MMAVWRRKTRSRAAAGLILIPLWTGALVAQENSTVPEGWTVRLDRGGHGGGDVSFQEMPPGWHVTTGPACILYDASHQTSGPYRAEMEVFLFDPGERREGYGLFFGGRDLDGDTQAYTYFLIRRDGRFLIKERRGSETKTIRGWEEHPAIIGWDSRAEGEDAARNALAVEVGADNISFEVNGVEVATLAASEIKTAGIVGLRVNHSLNLHVSRLESVEHNLEEGDR
jgi:hypothetical protein